MNKLSHKIRIVLKNSNCHTKDVTIYKEMPMKTIHDKHLMMITIPPFGIWKRVFENIYMYEHTHMSMFLWYCYIFSVWISNEILSQCTNQLFSHLRQVRIQGCYIMLLGPAWGKVVSRPVVCLVADCLGGLIPPSHYKVIQYTYKLENWTNCKHLRKCTLRSNLRKHHQNSNMIVFSCTKNP